MWRLGGRYFLQESLAAREQGAKGETLYSSNGYKKLTCRSNDQLHVFSRINMEALNMQIIW